jgi:dipeptidyl aminopeptidase/acylaminoacyl peptidase
LQGKLLLIVGELDRNVDPASTMQVVDALERADKDFELVVVPGGGHGSGSGTPYGRRRTEQFLVRNLQGDGHSTPGAVAGAASSRAE